MADALATRRNADQQSPILPRFHSDRADKLREDLAEAIERDDVVHIETLATALDLALNGSLAKSGRGQ